MKRNDLTEYLDVIEAFCAERMTAQEFESKYLILFKADGRDFPPALFEVLNALFTDVDAYVADPKIRRRHDLDEVHLRKQASSALEKLAQILDD